MDISSNFPPKKVVMKVTLEYFQQLYLDENIDWKQFLWEKKPTTYKNFDGTNQVVTEVKDAPTHFQKFSALSPLWGYCRHFQGTPNFSLFNNKIK